MHATFTDGFSFPLFVFPLRRTLPFTDRAKEIKCLVFWVQALQTGLHLPDEGRPCLPLEELEVPPAMESWLARNNTCIGPACFGLSLFEHASD